MNVRIIQAAVEALFYGKELASSAGWKNVQAVGSALAALFALSAALGYDFGVSGEAIGWGAAFIVAVANGIITLVTSKKVGLGKSRYNDIGMPVQSGSPPDYAPDDPNSTATGDVQRRATWRDPDDNVFN